MSKRTMMPKADFEAAHDVKMPLALDRWNPDIKASDDDSENVINILEVIGYDWWTDGGITGKSISAQLKDLTARILSLISTLRGVMYLKAWQSTTCCANMPVM